jgi:hypothetical protein
MWIKGSVKPRWNNRYKEFEYVRQPLTDKELIYWKDQGYNHQNFTGMMYDSTNPMPVWVRAVASEIGLNKCGYVFYKMVTGDIMPMHVDHYRRYCQVFDVEYKDVWRAIVFLEDWQSGHYFEINRHAFCNYKAGDYILWQSDTPHAASNIGVDDRYTLQITGVLD